jgi:hypothetical protein
MKTAMLAGALIAGLLTCASVAQADAPLDQSTFTFSGQCFGCTGPATATLTLQDYTPGAALANTNLVDFSYTSSTMSFDINPANEFLTVDSLSGSIGAAPDAYDVHIASEFLGFIPIGIFDSSSTGAWDASSGFIVNYGSDCGRDGMWNGGVSAAPEPSTWALMIAGVGLIGLTFRRGRFATGASAVAR